MDEAAHDHLLIEYGGEYIFQFITWLYDICPGMMPLIVRIYLRYVSIVVCSDIQVDCFCPLRLKKLRCPLLLIMY